MQFILSKSKAYLVSALIFTLIMVSLTPIVLAVILLAAIINKIVPQWMADIGLLLLFTVVIYMLYRKDAESMAMKLVTDTLRIPQKNSE
jgi:ABC-type nickel/cobalt efflux system permease component RcnA